MENKEEILALLAITLLAGFFLFHDIPQEVGDDAITNGNAALLINRAHETGRPAMELFEEASKIPGANKTVSPWVLRFMGLGTPFWTSLLSVNQWIFGVSAFHELLLASLLGFATVLVTYFVSRDMYGKGAGFLSALLLSTSLSFLILARSASGFLVLMALTVTSSAFLFYRAHSGGGRRFLWAAGIVLGLAFFNGYALGFLVVPILVLFVLGSVGIPGLSRAQKSGGKGTERLWKRDYLLFLSLILLVFFSLTAVWSLYANLPLTETHSVIYSPRVRGLLGTESPLTIGQTNYFRKIWLPSSLEWKIATAGRVLRLAFVQIEPWESLNIHAQQELLGSPMVAPFASAFFVLGLFLLLRRRSPEDKLCLSWLGVTFVAFAAFKGFFPRYLMLALPVIYIVAGYGLWAALAWMGKLAEKMPSPTLEKALRLGILLLIGLLFLLTAYTTYGDLFDDYYGAKDGNLDRFYGAGQVATWITERAPPSESLLVLGDPLIAPYDALFFYTGGQPYPAAHWWEDVLLATGGRGPREEVVPRLARWERKVLENKSHIFYIFGVGGRYNEMPGWNIYQQGDWHEFKELHPALQPAMRVYFSTGIPTLEVYEVNRTTPNGNSVSSEIDNNSTMEFFAPSGGTLEAVRIEGEAENLTLSGDLEVFTIPMKTLPSMDATITFDENSRILFTPTFDSEEYKNEAFDVANLSLNKIDNRGFLELDGASGYLIYRLESPFPIERLEMKSNPRVFNDARRQNAVSAFYSIDGKNYKRIYEVRSDGSGGWAVYYDPVTGGTFHNGIYERETYHILYPNVSRVYVKFLLEGRPGEAQLWSTKRDWDHWLKFDAKVDTSSLPRPVLKEGLNRVTVVTHAQGKTRVTLAANESLYPTHRYEAEDLLSFIGKVIEDGDALGGKARLATEKDPQGFLLYGPGTPFGGEGRYEALFWMKVGKNTSERVAKIDVVAGERTLGGMEIRGSDFLREEAYQEFILPFETAGAEALQYRVLYYPTTALGVNIVEVAPKKR